MKRYLPIIAILLIFLIGIGVLCYPLVSSVINNIDTRSEALRQMEVIKEKEPEEISELFAEADDYNESLLNTVIIIDPFDEEAYEAIEERYKRTFNTTEDGLIGYVDIPKINVYLPIYHGTSTEVLAHGAGHLDNTSFPVGGENTHSVISAHTAFPTETFFDYLTDLEDGDVFYIHVLNRTLKYQVDQIKVVLPEETSDLHVIYGRDLVTLLTCTPYSVNTHRLLVRGERVPYTEEPEAVSQGRVVASDTGHVYFLGYKISYAAAAAVILLFLLAVGGAVLLITRVIRRAEPEHAAGEDGDVDA